MLPKTTFKPEAITGGPTMYRINMAIYLLSDHVRKELTTYKLSRHQIKMVTATVEPKDISTASVRDLCLFIRG